MKWTVKKAKEVIDLDLLKLVNDELKKKRKRK